MRLMEDPKSKSQKKREADAIQKIGVELIALSLDKLNALPLTDPLKQAIIDAKSLRSHGAIRRQAQLIGKLMRNTDSSAILDAYQALKDEHQGQTASFHHVEAWRERLINEAKPALTEFIELYQPEDVQKLRQLIKKAVDEKAQSKNSGAGKALFRYLRLYIQ